MTNTRQITMNQAERLNLRGIPIMHGWTEMTQVVIRDRIREREIEAASERLAATSRATTTSRLRRNVGRLLIKAGRRVAGEPIAVSSAAGRPSRPIAAS